jgi:hypothetical protein
MIVAGIGCRRRCPAEDIVAAIRAAEAAVGCAVDALAAPDFKRNEPGLHAAAAQLHCPLHFIDDVALQRAQSQCVTRSAFVQASTGVASIAEAAALAANSGSHLILPRITVGKATCALAQKKELTTESTENTEDVGFSAADLAPPAKKQQQACGASFAVSSVFSVVHLLLASGPSTESRADKRLRNPPPQRPGRAECPSHRSARAAALADSARAYPPYKLSRP